MSLDTKTHDKKIEKSFYKATQFFMAAGYLKDRQGASSLGTIHG